MKRRQMLVRLGGMTLLVSMGTLPIRYKSAEGKDNPPWTPKSLYRAVNSITPLFHEAESAADLYVTTATEFDHTHSFIIPGSDLPVVLETTRKNGRNYGDLYSPPESGMAVMGMDTVEMTVEDQGPMETTLQSDGSGNDNVTYTTDVSGDHFHTVSLTTGELTRIAEGETVQTYTSEDAGHAHLVTINRYGVNELEFESSNVGGHTHTLVLSGNSTINPPIEGILLETGISGDHTHTVTLTAEQLTALESGETITVETSEQFGHSHTFEIRKIQFIDTTVVSSISGGHTHSFTLLAQDLVSLQDSGVSYATSFELGHSHVVSLTGDQLNSIAVGSRVTVFSSLEAGHLHSFSIQLA